MISQRVATALGVPRVLELIPAQGALMEGVKRRNIKLEPRSREDVDDIYSHLRKLISSMRRLPMRRDELRHVLNAFPTPFVPDLSHKYRPQLHELFLFKEFCWHYERTRNAGLNVYDSRCDFWPSMQGIFSILDIDDSGLPVFHLSPTYSSKLKEQTEEKHRLLAELDQERARHLEQASTELGIQDLKVEFILPRSQKELCASVLRSGHFITVAESFANLTFRLDDSPSELSIRRKLDRLQAGITKVEDSVLAVLGERIYFYRDRVEWALKCLEKFTWEFMLADFAITYDCCIPGNADEYIDINSAVNLPLKLHLEAKGLRYQKLSLKYNALGNIITGPNMGGKTSLLRTLGQLCVLRVMGIPLPCKQASLPWFETVWYNQDDPDGADDLSAFGREVVSFNAALEQPKPALFLLDEFAKGTNPSEGEALVTAVLKHLVSTGRFCVAATHFTAPALQKDFNQYSISGIVVTNTIIKLAQSLRPEQRLKMLSQAMDYRPRKLRKGQAPPRCAIAIAMLLGMPMELLEDIDYSAFIVRNP